MDGERSILDGMTIDKELGKSFLKKKHFLGEKEKETLYAVQECDCREFEDCKYVLLFFSAGWCPPCEQFQQLLKDFYNEVNIEARNSVPPGEEKLNKDGKVIDKKDVEIIYVSMDKDEASFKEAYARMPWLTYRWESGQH